MVSSLDDLDGSGATRNGSRISDLEENQYYYGPGAASTSTSTAAHERSNAFNGLHVTVAGIDVNNNNTYDASNLNEPLSRDIPFVPTRKPSSFTPVSSSNNNLKLPIQTRTPTTTTTILFTLPSHVSSPPPSIHNNMDDALDAISTYTADGEGDEDDVEIEDVTDIMALISSPSGRRYHEQNNATRSPPSYASGSPLFTPPPELEFEGHTHHHPIRLFTPHPSSPKPIQQQQQQQLKPTTITTSSSSFSSRKPPRKPRRRYIMSHIDVPPLKKPRSDYRPNYRFTTAPPPPSSTTTAALPSIIVNKRRGGVNSKNNNNNPVQDALQAAMQNNADVGVFSGGLDDKQKQKKRKRMMMMKKQRRDDGVLVRQEIVVGRPDQAKKMLKRSFNDDDDGDDDGEWGPPPKSKKPRPISEPMVVDLTISTDDDDYYQPPRNKISSSRTVAPSQQAKSKKIKVKPPPPPPPPPPPTSTKPPPPPPISKKIMPRRSLLKSSSSSSSSNKKFIHANYDAEKDVVMLCLEDIRPVPLEILTLNTRFLRQSVLLLGNGDVNANARCVRQNGYGSRRACLSNLSLSSLSLEEEEEDVSVGGVIREFATAAEEEWVEREVIEILSDDSDVLKENLPQENVPPFASTTTPLVKNQQHQKKPRGPPIIKRNQPRNQPIDSTFKVPLAPRAITETTIENRKTQYPRKKGREQPPQQQQQGDEEEQRKQHSEKDTTIPPVQISPWTVKGAVEPSSLNDSFESDYFNNGPTMPSAKALGKRRAMSPIIQMTSSPSSYGLFNAFIDDPTPPTTAVQEADSSIKNTFSLSTSSYDPLDTLTSLYDQAAASSIHIGSGDLDSSRHTSDDSSHVLAFDSQQQQQQPGSRGESFFSSDFLNDDVGFSPGDDHHHHHQQQQQQQHNYEDTTGGAWSSSSLVVVGNQPEDQIYAYETIDPTLLGGGEASSFGDDEMMMGMDVADDQKEGRIEEVDVGLSNDDEEDESSSANSLHSFVYPPPPPTETYTKKGEEQEQEKAVSSSLSSLLYERKLPPRNRVKRVLPDMVSHEDFDLMVKRKKAAKKTTTTTKTKTKTKNVVNNTRLSVSSTTTNSAPYHGDGDAADRSSSDVMMLTRKKTVVKKTKTKTKTNNTRLSVSSTNYSALDGDGGGADSSSSSSDSDSDDEVDDEDEDESDGYDEDEDEKKKKKKKKRVAAVTVRKPISISQPRVSLKDPIERSVSPPPKVDKKLTAAASSRKQEWPLDEYEAYCHQCRNKTYYAKMTCADCEKKFCVRCYALRYPECEFDADDEEYSCPACEGFCNCTICCRKRGEAYVGVRTCDKYTPPPQLQRPSRVKLGGANNSNLPPPPPPPKIKTTIIPEGATNAWGSLYSVTGEKIGACFFDPRSVVVDGAGGGGAGKDGNGVSSTIVFAPATTPIMTTMAEMAQQKGGGGGGLVVATAASEELPPTTKNRIKGVTKKKKKYKRRIFVGAVQDCWGYTKPRVKPLKVEPYPFKRSYNSMPRYYIGKKKYLFYPVVGGDDDDEEDEDEESSLTAMDESDEGRELGLEGGDLEGKSFLPDSLGDGDVTRAIFLGLTACGLAAVPATS